MLRDVLHVSQPQREALLVLLCTADSSLLSYAQPLPMVVPACEIEDLGTRTGREGPHLKVMLIVFGVFSHPGGEGAARIGLSAQGQTGQRAPC